MSTVTVWSELRQHSKLSRPLNKKKKKKKMLVSIRDAEHWEIVNSG
jgi:hypothetical protein